MPWFRAYLERKITDKGGGDFTRIRDGEAESAEAYQKALKLKKNEQVTQVVELIDPSQANV